MSRSTSIWFASAGVFGVARWIFEFADPQYFDPESALDYAAVVAQSAVGVATGIALLMLWRNPPVRRGSILLAVASLAAIAHGMGNLLQDAFDIGAGELGFIAGGIGMVLALLGAGVSALTVNSPSRWSGLFLIVGATGGMMDNLLIVGLAWIAFSIWIATQVQDSGTVVEPPATRA